MEAQYGNKNIPKVNKKSQVRELAEKAEHSDKKVPESEVLQPLKKSPAKSIKKRNKDN